MGLAQALWQEWMPRDHWSVSGVSLMGVLVGWFAFRSHCTLGIVSYKARFESPPAHGRSIRGSFWWVVAAAQICIRAHARETPGNLGS